MGSGTITGLTHSDFSNPEQNRLELAGTIIRMSCTPLSETRRLGVVCIGRRLVFGLCALIASVVWSKPLTVVGSTPDLCAIAEEVGGKSVTTVVICKSDQDPHSVELLPEHLLAVEDAVLYLMVGAGLDNWADEIIRAAKPGIKVVDCSIGISLLDTDHNHDQEAGVHEFGNPHYWLAPSNLLSIATAIAQALIEKNSYSTAYYRDNLQKFGARVDSATAVWKGKLEPCSGRGIVSYHSTWDYFARDFGIPVIATIESAPGQEPSPRDLAETLTKLEGMQVIAVVREPYSPGSLCEMVSRETGIPILTVSAMSKSPRGHDLWNLYDEISGKLADLCWR